MSKVNKLLEFFNKPAEECNMCEHVKILEEESDGDVMHVELAGRLMVHKDKMDSFMKDLQSLLQNHAHQEEPVQDKK
jgi:hypothetical protein